MRTPDIPLPGGERSDTEEVRARVCLPQVTHLQFLVLDALLRYPSGTSATMLRGMLRDYGEDREGPKFYQMMRRLEESGLAESWSHPFDLGGSEVARTYYRVTSQGRVSWRLTLEFYAVRLEASRRLRDPAATGRKRGEAEGA